MPEKSRIKIPKELHAEAGLNWAVPWKICLVCC